MWARPQLQVDHLVGDHHGAGAELPTQGAHGARGEHLAYAKGAQGPEVGPVGDAVRREAVVLAVPRDEGHAPPVQLADDEVAAGVAERRAHPHPLGVVEEGVEP